MIYTDRNRRISLEKRFNIDDLIFWSFRYFLGRMTIAAHCFAEDISASWDELSEKNRVLIEKELEEAFRDDDKSRSEGNKWHPLGMDMDRKAWEQVRAKYKGDSK